MANSLIPLDKRRMVCQCIGMKAKRQYNIHQRKGSPCLAPSALQTAWETTVEDIEMVLQDMKDDIALAPDVYGKLDREAVAKAALAAGTEMELQTSGAYDEIKRQIELFIVEGKI